jgi:hypothetical protein
VKLAAAGKAQGKIIAAVARELLGFIWAIGIRAELSSGREPQPNGNQRQNKTYLIREKAKPFDR